MFGSRWGITVAVRKATTGVSRTSIISRSRSCATRCVSWRAISPSVRMHLFHQVVAQHRLHSQRLDLVDIGLDLRLALLGILRCQRRRRRRAVHQRDSRKTRAAHVCTARECDRMRSGPGSRWPGSSGCTQKLSPLARACDRLRHVAHQQVRHQAGEQRAGTNGDEVGILDRFQWPWAAAWRRREPSRSSTMRRSLAVMLVSPRTTEPSSMMA